VGASTAASSNASLGWIPGRSASAPQQASGQALLASQTGEIDARGVREEDQHERELREGVDHRAVDVEIQPAERARAHREAHQDEEDRRREGAPLGLLRHRPEEQQRERHQGELVGVHHAPKSSSANATRASWSACIKGSVCGLSPQTPQASLGYASLRAPSALARDASGAARP
jgi:hypothetical protein